MMFLKHKDLQRAVCRPSAEGLRWQLELRLGTSVATGFVITLV